MFNFEKSGSNLEQEKQNKEASTEVSKANRLLKITALFGMLLGNEALGLETKKPEQLQKEISKIEAVVKNDPDKTFKVTINGSLIKRYGKEFKDKNTIYDIGVEDVGRGIFIKKIYTDESGTVETRLFFDEDDIKTGKPDGRIDALMIVPGEIEPLEEAFAEMDVSMNSESDLKTETSFSSIKRELLEKNGKSIAYSDRAIFKVNSDGSIFLVDMKSGDYGRTDNKEQEDKYKKSLQSKYSSVINEINKIIENKK